VTYLTQPRPIDRLGTKPGGGDYSYTSNSLAIATAGWFVGIGLVAIADSVTRVAAAIAGVPKPPEAPANPGDLR
jgi:hypothetical protein